MQGLFRKLFLFFKPAALFCLLFAAGCTDFGTKNSVCLKLDSTAVQKIVNSARNGDNENQFKLIAALKGSYSSEQTVWFSKGPVEVVFDEVPVGETVYAEVSVYVKMDFPADEPLTSDGQLTETSAADTEQLLYTGQSDKITLKEGLNELKVTLKKIDSPEPHDPDNPPDPIEEIEMTLYISADGNDANDGRSLETALKTLNQASLKMIEYGNTNVNWTIYVSGTVTGIPSETSGTNAQYGESKIYDVTGNNAKSIHLTGLTPLSMEGLTSTDTAGYPTDIIDRGLQSAVNTPQNGTALRIETEVPVTITNLGITGGLASKGAGLFIAQNATVKLGDGVRITGNSTGSGGGYGGGVHNEGTLFMYGSAVIGNQYAQTWASGSSTQSLMYPYMPSQQAQNQYNGNYGTSGGGICNGAGNSSVTAKLYLGYSGFSEDGETPVAEELTGGIFANGASKGAGIFNDKNCLIYYKSGTVKYNTASSNGGGIYNDSGSNVEMTGGCITDNLAYFPNNSDFYGGGIYNNGPGTFSISGGTITSNYATIGGGIYNGGKMYLFGTAVVGDSTASAAADETSYGNKACQGAAIYNDGAEFGSIDSYKRGTLYIGYKDENTVDADYTQNGGIFHNLATKAYDSSSSENCSGGAVYNSGKVYMASGTIAYNSADQKGGAVYGGYRGFEVSGGTIRDNSAQKSGGAFFLSYDNELTLKGSPSIPCGSDNANDIFLNGNSSNIHIAGALSYNFTALLSFDSYTRTQAVLVLTGGSDTTIDAERGKFSIKPFTTIDSDNVEYTLNYSIDSNGKLTQQDDQWQGSVPDHADDITFTVDLGEDSNINVNVDVAGGSSSSQGNVWTITDPASTQITFTADPDYTSYIWKLDGAVQDATTHQYVLILNREQFTPGAVYDISLTAVNSDGTEDSFFAQLRIAQ